MGREIERKYLVKNDRWKTLVDNSYSIRQGYLSNHPDRTVRIRVKGNKGLLTIKGKNVGISRPEYEYSIPIKDAEEMFALCSTPLIEKIRNEIKLDNHIWEIDEFSGALKGLVLAEIELKDEQEQFDIPEWIGNEVSHDPRYYNSNLSKNVL